MQACLTCRFCNRINQPGVKDCIGCGKPLYVVLKPALTRDQIKGLIVALFVVLLVFVATRASRAQTATRKPEPCKLSVSESPEVRGLKLGQSPALIDSIFPDKSRIQIKDDYEPDEIGVFRKLLTGRRANLDGIAFLRLTYIDSNLGSVEITYDNSVKWDSDAHFAAAIADQLKLPTVGWVSRIGYPRLDCDGFFVEVRHLLGGQLVIERSDLQKQLADRQAKLEAKKRAAFKP